MRWTLLAFAAVGLIAAACSGGAPDVDDETTGSLPTPGGETATTIPIDDGREDGVFPVVSEEPPTLTPRYIGGTGGRGVAVREACETEARAGSAWPDGTLVRLLDAEDAECEGWSYVAGPSVSSWVRDEYLVSQRPASVAAAPLPPVPNGPMFLYGNATPHTTIGITAGDRFCRLAIVDAQGRWSTAIGPADECAPQPGDTLTFTRNGVIAPTAYARSWIPNATRGIAFTN